MPLRHSASRYQQYVRSNTFPTDQQLLWELRPEMGKSGEFVYRFFDSGGSDVITHDASGDCLSISPDGRYGVFQLTAAGGAPTWFIFDFLLMQPVSSHPRNSPSAGVNTRWMWADGSGSDYIRFDGVQASPNLVRYNIAGVPQWTTPLPQNFAGPASDPSAKTVQWRGGNCSGETEQFIFGYASIGGADHHCLQAFNANTGDLINGPTPWWVEDVTGTLATRFHNSWCGIGGCAYEPAGALQATAYWSDWAGTQFVQLEPGTPGVQYWSHQTYDGNYIAYVRVSDEIIFVEEYQSGPTGPRTNLHQITQADVYNDIWIPAGEPGTGQSDCRPWLHGHWIGGGTGAIVFSTEMSSVDKFCIGVIDVVTGDLNCLAGPFDRNEIGSFIDAPRPTLSLTQNRAMWHNPIDLVSPVSTYMMVQSVVAGDDEFTMTDPYVAEAFDVTANDSNLVPPDVDIMLFASGSATGNSSVNNAAGEVTYLPSPDEHGQQVTVDMEVTNTSTGASDTSTLTINVPMKPMQIFLGNVLLTSEIDDAIANGWQDGFAAFINDPVTASSYLSHCQSVGRLARLSLGGTWSNANIDTLLADPNFATMVAFEFEGSTTPATKQYAKEQLIIGGDEDKLYSYQNEYFGATSLTITNITVAGPTVTITTSAPHGLSNGALVALSNIQGAIGLNYTHDTIANASGSTFDLATIDGSSLDPYTGDGRVYIDAEAVMQGWRNRSRLWYPWSYDNPESSYDPDNSSTNVAVTGATQANPVVVTAAGHPYVNGQTVSIKNIVGMVEINDRQFTVANATGSTFELEGEDGTVHTAYASGGNTSTSSLGVPRSIGARKGMPFNPLRENAAWRYVDPTIRRGHMWLQAFGQPSENKDWAWHKTPAVQPGKDQVFMQLWAAHQQGMRQCSYFGCRSVQFVNRHAGTSQVNSEVDYLWAQDNNSLSPLSPAQAAVWNRGWDYLLEGVADYKAGPGTTPNFTDNAFGEEVPIVAVEGWGQSLTRR